MSPTTRNRVEVLHGVNLDQLGRRDPEIYGDYNLTELEHRVRAWARELGPGRSLLSVQQRG